jgi:hypothetical protein
MSLGIKDSDRIRKVFPWVDSAMSYARDSIANEISIFGEGSRFYRLGNNIGMPVVGNQAQECQGSVDEIVPIIGTDNYLHIRGWLFEGGTESNKPYPLFPPGGNLKGYILLGKARPDVAKAVSPEAMHSGFGGYIMRRPGTGRRIAIQLEEKLCWMELPFNDLSFRISEPDWDEVMITVGDVIKKWGLG